MRPSLLLLLLAVVHFTGLSAEESPPVEGYEAQYAALCAACASMTQEEAVSATCFDRLSRACDYQPQDIDPAESPRVANIMKAFPFCIGFTSPSSEAVSYGTRMRVLQWRDRYCPPLPPSALAVGADHHVHDEV